jgi:hypothetical protein
MLKKLLNFGAVKVENLSSSFPAVFGYGLINYTEYVLMILCLHTKCGFKEASSE